MQADDSRRSSRTCPKSGMLVSLNTAVSHDFERPQLVLFPTFSCTPLSSLPLLPSARKLFQLPWRDSLCPNTLDSIERVSSFQHVPFSSLSLTRAFKTPSIALFSELFAEGRVPTPNEIWETYDAILEMPGCLGYTRRIHSNWATGLQRRRQNSPRGMFLLPRVVIGTHARRCARSDDRSEAAGPSIPQHCRNRWLGPGGEHNGGRGIPHRRGGAPGGRQSTGTL